MKKFTRIILSITAIAVLLTTTAYASESTFGSGAVEEGGAYTVEEMLEYALQDEQMAQAEYEAIIEEFGVNAPFSNILRAEGRHEAAVLSLYELYEIDIPTFDADEHVVIPETLEEIYNIGVTAEIANIAMYDAFLSQELDDNMRVVFEALREASVSHQAAFEQGQVSGGNDEGDGNMAQRGQSSESANTASSGNGFGNESKGTNAESGNGSSNSRQQRGQGNSGQMVNQRSQAQEPENCDYTNYDN